MTSGHGSYDYVINQIKNAITKRLKSANTEYYLRGTFTNKNLDFSNDIIHLADLGFKQISIEPVVSLDGDYIIRQQHLDTILSEYDKITDIYLERLNSNRAFELFCFKIDLDKGPCVIKRCLGCGAGQEYLAIAPNGDVYPCHQFVGNSKYLFGNINDSDDLSCVTVDPDFHKSNIFTKHKCTKCWAKFYCGGGCHANNSLINNNIYEPYEISCRMQKKRLECALYIKSMLAC